jgi:hypothetical protein
MADFPLAVGPMSTRIGGEIAMAAKTVILQVTGQQRRDIGRL